MNYKYRTSGVCSSMVEFDLDDGIVTNVKYTGGCNGNLKGIAAMAEGMKAEDVIKKLEGIKCGFKNTSCPDQFAKALRTALSQG